MSPSWSPDGTKLAYVSFESEVPHIFVQEIATGNRELVAAFPGINGAPAFSPDGRRLAMTLSKDGNTEIYVMDLGSKRLRRVTNNPAIDTEPSWSPDGRTLAFTSDRGGKPQVYRTVVEGGRPERVTFEGSYNARPVFSPDGTKLALVHRDEGRYRIGPARSGERRASGADGIEPRRIAQLRAERQHDPVCYDRWRQLGAVGGSPDGRMRQRLNVQTGGVREPAWSPFRN